MEHKRNPYRFT